ncbi:MAG: hypothetical protein ABEL51_06180 [Salinibacter sp.]
MRGSRVIGTFMLAALAVVVGSSGMLVSNEDPGTYQPDRSWATPYFDHLFTLEKAKAAGYVQSEPHCVPGMGYHYIKPEEAKAWFSGKQGGLQVLLYDRTGFLVGVEYLMTAPSLEARSVAGMEGPMEGHTDGMPIHYEQHIYFTEPKCPEEG